MPRAGDPLGDRIRAEASALGIEIGPVHTARVYLIEAAIGDDRLAQIAAGLLANPVTESAIVGSAGGENCSVIEVHPLPGVMDPAAASIRDALQDLYGIDAEVSTGIRYVFEGTPQATADELAARLLSNPVVQAVCREAFCPDELPKGHEHESPITRVPIRGLDGAALETLSRDAHLFLSLDEMRAVQDEYERLGREPTAIELETLAQTWSEHCVHKTFKSTIVYRSDVDNDPINWSGRPGHTVNADGTVTIENLLKSTVAAATFELIDEGLDWTLSVFVDNAGVIVFDDEHAINIKVETHNHPSALEPYGGAATGIGGCIRDVIATGLGAKPIANTDVFCVATPGIADVPAGCIHPARVLDRVVAGVRDYGNRMGIPTLNGAVWFDDRYIGNPLVYCGCVGIMPRGENDCMVSGAAKPGDRIIAIGGKTGRDGIHGATFSSAELTDTHSDEFSHAVQIGNAIEEKRALDAILRARDAGDAPLFSAITDCGAGGFSSAVGEMGERLGADVHLEGAPLKYPGLTHTEIWISEAQERFVLAVPVENISALQQICDEEHAEFADLGKFGTEGRELILNHAGREVGRLPMSLLHDGIPMPTREAVWSPARPQSDTNRVSGSTDSIGECLLALLAAPNIASKHRIIRQYDHEVQGNTVISPLGGPSQRGPMDAAVIEPVPGTGRGLAIASGLATGLGDPACGGDAYLMALGAIDECVRNLVCVGADPERIAILDNFSWPSCQKPGNLASLVRAAEGCYDAAKAYKTPFVSGKDSLNNQFTIPGEDGETGQTIEIPPTLLITGIGIVEKISGCVTMDAKAPGNRLLLVSEQRRVGLGGSAWQSLFGTGEPMPLPVWNFEHCAANSRAVSSAIRSGGVRSAHDVSDGGVLVSIAEMLIAGSTNRTPIGAALSLAQLRLAGFAFSEQPGGYVLEVGAGFDIGDLAQRVQGEVYQLGLLTDSGRLCDGENLDIEVEALASAWLGNSG